MGLSAGVMLFISLAELLPQSQALMAACWSGKGGGAMALVAFFIGMGVITLIDFIVPEYENPHEATGLSLDGHANIKRLGVMSAIAIAVHNFPEGIATFIGALNDPQTGAGITFAIALHNIPEGIAVAIPIYYATKKKGKAFLWAMLSGLSRTRRCTFMLWCGHAFRGGPCRRRPGLPSCACSRGRNHGLYLA